jgi:NTP pyrophosphatase (non-canonical NTP hydrolase)
MSELYNDIHHGARAYQSLAARTLLKVPPRQYTDHELMLVWNALGAAGEAGELAGEIKKAVFHDRGLDSDTIEKIAKEAGDTMWYLAGVLSVLDEELGAAMVGNIEKLRKRYPNGFNAEDSKARVDVAAS